MSDERGNPELRAGNINVDPDLTDFFRDLSEAYKDVSEGRTLAISDSELVDLRSKLQIFVDTIDTENQRRAEMNRFNFLFRASEAEQEDEPSGNGAAVLHLSFFAQTPITEDGIDIEKGIEEIVAIVAVAEPVKDSITVLKEITNTDLAYQTMGNTNAVAELTAEETAKEVEDELLVVDAEEATSDSADNTAEAVEDNKTEPADETETISPAAMSNEVNPLKPASFILGVLRARPGEVLKRSDFNDAGFASLRPDASPHNLDVIFSTSMAPLIATGKVVKPNRYSYMLVPDYISPADVIDVTSVASTEEESTTQLEQGQSSQAEPVTDAGAEPNDDATWAGHFEHTLGLSGQDATEAATSTEDAPQGDDRAFMEQAAAALVVAHAIGLDRIHPTEPTTSVESNVKVTKSTASVVPELESTIEFIEISTKGLGIRLLPDAKHQVELHGERLQSFDDHMNTLSLALLSLQLNLYNPSMTIPDLAKRIELLGGHADQGQLDGMMKKFAAQIRVDGSPLLAIGRGNSWSLKYANTLDRPGCIKILNLFGLNEKSANHFLG